jgi:hypothetical protein
MNSGGVTQHAAQHHRTLASSAVATGLAFALFVMNATLRSK